MKPTVLFDFDGVIVDTEPIYDIFWNDAAVRYKLGIDHFAALIKGTTMPDIMANYFSGFPREIQEQVLRESAEYEAGMDFPTIAGSLDFIRMLKEHEIKIGLVTSSDDNKVNRAFDLLSLRGVFDTVVTADRITRGKPDPMCYLLAASDLKASPYDCLVFEDSLAGIASATAAGMRVIGISSSNPAELLRDKTYDVIPHFGDVSFEKFESWCR